MQLKCMLLCVLVFTIGCESVKPWQRGNLARPEMSFAPDPLERALDEHIYFSKEASSSGSAISGGGCGCN